MKSVPGITQTIDELKHGPPIASIARVRKPYGSFMIDIVGDCRGAKARVWNGIRGVDGERGGCRATVAPREWRTSLVHGWTRRVHGQLKAILDDNAGTMRFISVAICVGCTKLYCSG